MPRNKDLKRLVRARMKKTGEAYTAARAQIVATPNHAKVAGMSDAVIKGKTGCTWDRWVRTLDRLGAAEMSHREIARLVSEKFKTGDWWSQTVTVGYERVKGLRARGQRRDGTYELSKSRTFDVPVETLFDAWADASSRKRWLDRAEVRVRTATAPKSMRLDWTDGSIIAIGFMPKGKTKGAVAVQHTKLRDKETVNRLKEFWSERLNVLRESLVDG
ncbi:MAG: SRPBCC family protein [Gemmatimonadaceae bacterium]